MSRFISNKSCEMCHNVEVGLAEMRVGNTHHYLCHNCMAIFAFDAVEYAAHNLREEFKRKGYTINATNDEGFVIKKKDI